MAGLAPLAAGLPPRAEPDRRRRAGADPIYPRPGDRFANYHLRSILGIGGAARVYLATDDELDEAEVALKISASIGREPSILAKLDHRNIVPILRVTKPEAGLQGFCMPYRPGVTLEALIHRLGTSTAAPGRPGGLGPALMAPDAEAGVAVPQGRPGRLVRLPPSRGPTPRPSPGSAWPWPTPWPTCTPRGSSIATSSRPTSCWPIARGRSSWTSTSPTPPAPRRTRRWP